MTPPEPDLKAIFSEALDLPAGPKRSVYLDEACEGDAALRLRVETLLKAHDEAGGFLASSPKGPTPAAGGGTKTEAAPDDAALGALGPAIAEGPGATIGPYKLLQKIGEGGMGAVFMAEQERPVRRKVALKVIKPGMDTGQVIARFEAERQALAMMEHPNIARVLDVGATDAGRPYFVMELVKGVPITEYCDRNGLTLKERLELFIPVCQAIQHAHQKGIIHRDVKPSNVLVTLHDGKAVPMVIDFGVAKAIDQRLTERTMFTEFGAVVGTLEYMSPEQAEMGALDVDTRSDVYSLGVLLYELLTGSTPLERVKLRAAGYAEILKRIREEEPTRPSTRLSESKEALPSISAQRKIEPARLKRFVRGDLDWIVMKSLEKDRKRRYETANGFARDVRRFLDGDPVEACPPSRPYRLRKFARKHRAALAAAGAFAVLLVVATAISMGLAVWANKERLRAVAAENSAKEQKDRAEDRERMAIDAVKRFGEVVRDTPELKNTPSLEKLRATLLKEPQAFFKRLRDRLQADQETTPDSLARLADANFDLGRLTAEIGDKEDALRAYEESLAIRERLARENPSVARFQSDMAISHANVGNVQRETGRPAEALASVDRARAVFERLAREDPSATRFHCELAWSHAVIGALQREAGRPAEALASHERALAIRERLARDNPSVAQFQRELGMSHDAVSSLQREAGRPAEALASHERALATFERLAREDPSVTQFRSDLAASLQREAGRPAEVLASHERALAILERLAREDPSVTQFQSDLAWIHANIGDLLRKAGRAAEALASRERACAIFERLARSHPESPEFARKAGMSLHDMAVVDLWNGRFEEARAKLTRAVEWQRKVLAADPDHPHHRRVLADHLADLIRVAEILGRVDEAAEARRERGVLRDSEPSAPALDARLDSVLKANETPNDERIRLAYRAYEKEMYSASARLFSSALASDPKLGDDRRAQHRYNAACVAALTASGRGRDDPPPDAAAGVKLRRQALEWLKAELSAWAKVLDADSGMKGEVETAMKYWKVDPDLVGVRDEQELARLPEDERAGFKQLWGGVDRLLAGATAGE